MARRALVGLALLLSFALLRQASATRVLHEDPEPDADDMVVRVPDVVGSGLTAHGYINVEISCDLSVEDAWDTSDCSLEDDGSIDPVKFALGANALAWGARGGGAS